MADQRLTRHLNELSIVNLLRKEGVVTRSEIAKTLSLTPGSVTKLISSMRGRGLVMEVNQRGGEKKDGREPGRPGIGVSLDPNGMFFVGVEIDVGLLRCVLLDLSCGVRESFEQTISAQITPREAAEMVGEIVENLQNKRLYSGKIRALGATVPGLVTNSGHIVHLPILGWKDVDFQALLSERTNLRCMVENNANAAAFGASYTHSEMSEQCVVHLKIGVGCGGAAVVNGRLLRGGSGTASEFGHIRVSDKGPTCSCGQTGCLETWVNIAALSRAYNNGPVSGRDMGLPTRVAEAADGGDQAATEAIESIAVNLGVGISILSNVFNPSLVVLGGIMRPVLRLALENVQQEVARRVVPGIMPPDVVLSPLGLPECAVGAAAIAHLDAFDVAAYNDPF